MPDTYCTNHCATCDAHFTSLRAFDAHRRGACLATPRGPYVQVDGFCRLIKGRNGEKVPASIWQAETT